MEVSGLLADEHVTGGSTRWGAALASALLSRCVGAATFSVAYIVFVEFQNLSLMMPLEV